MFTFKYTMVRGYSERPSSLMQAWWAAPIGRAVGHGAGGTSRYRAFQATETAIYLAVALALAGYCFRRISRRQS